MEQLRGRTALVTGATGGIGRQIARRLARDGMNVIASGRREDVLAELVAELRGLGVRRRRSRPTSATWARSIP